MFNRYRIFAAYLFAIPLALILGFLAASPNELTIMLIGMLLFCLALPLLIKWHHAMLIIFWNSAFNAFFLPGTPNFWLLFAAMSFGISFLDRIMGRRPFPSVPEMTRPLVVLMVVVLITALLRGGIGIKALGGSSYGGKKYVLIFGAVMGYFAFTAGHIAKSRRMTGLFFISGITPAFSNLAYTLGPGFYFLFYLLPTDVVSVQVASDLGLTDIDRISGLAPASIAALCFLLARYGIRGLLDVTRPWRFVLLCLTFVACLYSGFRSVLALLILIFAFQFYFEGLVRTRFFPVLVGLGIFTFGSMLLFANKMPHAVQRAMSFLPVNVDPEIVANAKGSTDWRWAMWAEVSKEIPRYLFLGKGYNIDPADISAAIDSARMGTSMSDYEGSMVAGDYHNGPLSIIIPFGIFGTLAFIWVLVGGFRVLHSNYRYGDDRLRVLNSVLLSYYLAYCIAFFAIFGAFESQLYIFLGTVGMSVSLNGGIKRKPRDDPERQHISQPRAFAIEA